MGCLLDEVMYDLTKEEPRTWCQANESEDEAGFLCGGCFMHLCTRCSCERSQEAPAPLLLDGTATMVLPLLQ